MLCKQVSCPKCAHRFVVALSGQSTSTGEKIHDCGFIHGDFEPCPTKVSRFNEQTAPLKIFLADDEPVYDGGKLMEGMMSQDRDWRYEWLRRTVERMDEFEQRGEENITLRTREFQRILMELLAMHQRCNRLEEVLCSYAKYAFPVNHTIQPPAMFGGETVGRFSSAHPNEANGPKP